MKKLFTFLLALMASSCLWAEITYELDGGKYNDYDWTCKADICYNLQVDYNAEYSKSLSWAKKENGVVYYNINGTWMTETEAKGQEANVAKFLQATTYNTTNNLLTIVEDTHKAKYGWLKDVIVANRQAQSLGITIDEALYRKELSAFFLCSPKNTSYPTNSSYETTGDYEDFQLSWGQTFPNPEHPTEEVTLVAPHKTGYIFGGWYDNPECTGTPITTVNASTTGTLYAKWVLDGIVYELNGGKYNDYGWTCKADICLDLEADYNATYNTTKDWVKKEGDVIKYCVNGTWVTEEEAKGSAANIAGFIHNNTWTADGKFSTLILTTKADKYGWLKEMITANREAQSITLELNDAAYRQEVSAFFLCSPTLSASGIISSSYEITGDYEDYQPYWGQTFPNPEHPTEEVTLYAPIKEGCKFLGWYDNEACTGTPVTKVDQNYKGTLYAKWVLDGIAYELNGGVWNEYGWTSKKDMYDAFLADWKAYSGSTRGTKTYEEQLGVGKSSAGIPTTISNTTPSGVEYRSLIIPFFTESNYQTKWGWLATYIDAVAAQQGKTQPTTNASTLTYSLGNFFGEDNSNTTNYIGAVDFTGAEAHIAAFQTTWRQSFPGIEHPTESTVLHIAYKQRHNFEGWYDNAECTGTAITIVDENYAGTLYAKWNLAPLVYELNGGQYNQYGWENKGDICLALEADYNATYGTSKDWVQKVDDVIQYNINGTWMTEEEAKGQESTVAGFLQASTYNTTDNLKKLIETTMVDKYGWLKDVIVANREEQSVAGELSEAIYRKELSAFFLHSPAHSNWPASSSYEGAGELITYQAYWNQSFPNPTYPKSAVVLNAPYKEGYEFDGWYANSDFSGAKITVVDETTNGTLYAKWLEHFYTRSVTNGRYGTICLPYGSSNMTGAIFYEVAYLNESTMRVFVDEVTELEAGKPYIFMATSNLIKVLYQGEEALSAGDHNGLYGTFTNIEDGAAGAAGNVLEGNHMLSNNQIMKCLGNCQLLANRAYFKLDEIRTTEPALVPGRRRVALGVQGGNEATGLDNLTEDGVAPAMEGTYDVLGRKMTEPTNNGFYIVNGKKVVVLK